MRFWQLTMESIDSVASSKDIPTTISSEKRRYRLISPALALGSVLVVGVVRAEGVEAHSREASAVDDTNPEPASPGVLDGETNAADVPNTEPATAASRAATAPHVTVPGPPAQPAAASDQMSGSQGSTASAGDDVSGTNERMPARVPDSAYRERFELARAALIDNRDQEALTAFEQLALDAPNAEDRRVAEEFASLARERVSARQRDLPPPHLRTTDELSVLYTTAFTYGFGTSAWLALQVKPSNFAAAVLPFVAITGAAVGGVALIDNYSPFRLGVPHSISAGTLLGALEGVWLTGYQNAVASRRDEESWRSPTVATVLWAGATLGGVAGGLLGSVREPTPGQVSYTTSAALWGGAAGALLAGATESRTSYRAERAYAVGALGYNVALLAALATSPQHAPSVARIRLVDLGGLAGGLLGAGAYLLVADEDSSSRAAMGASAAGALVGLGLSWWATAGMPDEPHPLVEQTLLSRLRPTVVPVRQGAVGIVELTL